jgi:hypothetical protein
MAPRSSNRSSLTTRYESRMQQQATLPSAPKPDASLTKMPSEVLQNIFRILFEEAAIDLKKPHDMTQAKLIRLFPILSVDERLLAEGLHVLLRHAILEIENLTNFPQSGPALKMLRKVRHLSLQTHQLVTFQLSRQFPRDALRSSRSCFENLQKIDISVTSTLQCSNVAGQLGSQAALAMIDSVWRRHDDLEVFEICSDYRKNELVEFIKVFQRRYTIVLKMEFWIGGRLVSCITPSPIIYQCSD